MTLAHVVLVRPQIATNTGNIIRLCANTGAALHLVEPLGFSLDESSVKRAGLDYHELTSVVVHASLSDALATTGTRVFGLTAHADRRHHEIDYQLGDTIVFGTERDGLDRADLALIDAQHQVRIPMRPHNRSLNLANAVAVVAYEMWRQLGFAGEGRGSFAERVDL